jgi:transposase
MLYVGCDLHKQSITACVMNQDKKVVTCKKLRCADEEAIRSFFKELGEFVVAVEATCGYEWFAELVGPMAARFILAEPNRLKQMMDTRFKSDRIDARKMATILVEGYMPACYIPTAREREHRALIRHRCAIQRRITSAKARLHNLAWRYNADSADLFGKGWERFTEVAVSEADAFVRDQLWRQLGFLQEQHKAAWARVEQFAKAAPLLERERRALLRTIPGVGPITTEVVLAELGDPARFSSAARMASYAGLAPGKHESAGKERERAITKAGSRLLRWALIEAAWQAVRYSRRWRRAFERIAARRGRKKAIVAIARRMLGVICALLRTGQPYEAAYAFGVRQEQAA